MSMRWKRQATALLSIMIVAAPRIQGAELAAAGDASDYVVTAWDIGEGLPDGTVSAIVQSSDGYLWLGTFGGLVRFNGLTFEVFDPSNTPALPSAGIVNLHHDRKGRLWVSTLEGLVIREGTQWRPIGANDHWTGNFVRTFSERSNGDLLLTTFDGQVLVFTNERIERLPDPPGEPGQGYLGAVDKEGHWWVAQNRFVGRWDGQQWISMHTPPPSVGSSAVLCFKARAGGIWLLLGPELLRFQGSQIVHRQLLPTLGGGKWSMQEDGESQLWICSYDVGLFQLAPGGEPRLWTTDTGLGYRSARASFEDREGNLWIGTNGGGLRRLKPRRFKDIAANTLLEQRAVVSIAPAADGGTWIATGDIGLLRYDASGWSRVPVPGPAFKAIYGRAVLEDRSGHVWYGDSDRCWWRKKGDEHFEVVPLPSAVSGGTGTFFEDSMGRVWIASGQGVAFFDGKTFRAVGPEAGLPPMWIKGFAEDASGIWMAGAGGVYLFADERCAEVRPAGESLRNVLCLKPGDDGAMWLGTRDAGLLRWQNGQITRVSTAQGLPAVELRAILEDDLGFFWLTSNRGILRVHQDQLHEVADGRRRILDCQLLNQADGMPGSACPVGQPTCARDGAGQFWFATQLGPTIVDPARLRLNMDPPPVHVERLRYRVRPSSGPTQPVDKVYELTAPFPTPLRLPAGSHSIELEYAALSLGAPERVRFQFLLEGDGQDWQDVPDRRVRFHQLPPKPYLFRVRAANPDGVWNNHGASLAFTVEPHYWQTRWFRLGGALFLVSLGGFVVWSRSQSRIRQALERERVANEIRDLAGRLINAQEDERRRIARELHDDFSQRLALLSVEMELANASANSATNPTPRMAAMATRVKELSTEVHRMAYELHPAKLDQLGLVAAGRSFCRELSEQSGVRVLFEAGEFPRVLRPELALCLYRILQESLYNVVSHSGATEARVELRAEPHRVRLVVTDGGRGFNVERALREGGLGLSSMSERVRLVRGSLNVASRPGGGTRVEVCAPLN